MSLLKFYIRTGMLEENQIHYTQTVYHSSSSIETKSKNRFAKTNGKSASLTMQKTTKNARKAKSDFMVVRFLFRNSGVPHYCAELTTIVLLRQGSNLHKVFSYRANLVVNPPFIVLYVYQMLLTPETGGHVCQISSPNNVL